MGVACASPCIRRLVRREFRDMENPYLEVCRTLPRDGMIPMWPWQGKDTFPRFYLVPGKTLDFRRTMVNRFAWAIPNETAVLAIAEYSPLIEIGAGTGYWAWLLRQVGADVIAFDRETASRHLYSEVRIGGPEQIAAYPSHTLLLCWPPHDDPMVTECLDRYRGKTLLYVGAGPGATGWDERLDRWERVTEINIPQWDGIRDGLTVYRAEK
jgi:hypothetical protein